MDTIDLKESLIAKLQIIDNEYILKGVSRLLELETQFEDIYKLSNQQRERLKESRQQIEKGEYITDLELNLKIDAWLSE